MMALLCFFLTLVPVGNVPGHDETTLEMRSRHSHHGSADTLHRFAKVALQRLGGLGR
jgi:hypothetical protein